MRILAVAALMLAITVLVALTGPFGTFDEGTFWVRFVYWGVANSLALFIALALKFALRDVLAGPQFWVGELNIIIGTTLVFTPLLFLWTVFWFPQIRDAPPDLLWLGLHVLMITFLVSAIRYGVPFLLVQAGLPPAVAPPPPLLDRVPEEVRGPVVRLEGEGHYVLVVTEQGTARIRLRLSDAVREMGTVEGHWTHRSHWVTAQAVSGAVEEGNRPLLTLANGDRVPVSRTYHPQLSEAGLI